MKRSASAAERYFYNLRPVVHPGQTGTDAQPAADDHGRSPFPVEPGSIVRQKALIWCEKAVRAVQAHLSAVRMAAQHQIKAGLRIKRKKLRPVRKQNGVAAGNSGQRGKTSAHGSGGFPVGKAGSGKDYVAAAMKESIERKYPKKRVMITHFADLLKYLMATYENWNGEKDEAGRRRLQQLGTDIVRKWDSDYWAKRMCEFIFFYKDMYDIFIVPDLRFVNEYLVVSHIYLSKFILVTCPDNDSVLTEEQQHHISETDLYDLGGNPLIKPMFTIENHKDEEESTKGAVDSIVDQLIKGE